MSSSASRNSASFTASAAIRSVAGSKDSACEHPEVSPADRHSLMGSSANAQAANQERTSTPGTGSEPPPSSTRWDTKELDGPFSIRSSGNVGQEIVDADGRVVSWTTDELVAAVICRLLNENEELLH